MNIQKRIFSMNIVILNFFLQCVLFAGNQPCVHADFTKAHDRWGRQRESIFCSAFVADDLRLDFLRSEKSQNDPNYKMFFKLLHPIFRLKLYRKYEYLSGIRVTHIKDADNFSLIYNMLANQRGQCDLRLGVVALLDYSAGNLIKRIRPNIGFKYGVNDDQGVVNFAAKMQLKNWSSLFLWDERFFPISLSVFSPKDKVLYGGIKCKGFAYGLRDLKFRYELGLNTHLRKLIRVNFSLEYQVGGGAPWGRGVGWHLSLQVGQKE